MGKITFILGGTRSGKSSYAQQLAQEKKAKCAFIATCRPQDNEMRARIRKHQKARPKHWQTFESYEDISLLLKKIGAKFDIILIDCLTLLISNFMLDGHKEHQIKKKIDNMTSVLNKIKAHSIIVSNEVGLGIVPENKLAREFRDIAGRANQNISKKADDVYFLVSGIPWKIK